MIEPDDTLYIVNPYAQEGQAKNIWKQMRSKYSYLPKDPVDITKEPHILPIIKKRKPKLIVIAGGDGTINSVVQQVLNIKNEDRPKLAIIPLGFGNALGYAFGVDTIEKAIDVITSQKQTITIDLMKTNIKESPIGIFNISFGFDARIIYNRMNHKYIGIRSYIISAVRSFMDHRDKEIIVTIDRKTKLRVMASSFMVANCPIVGKNYTVSSSAKFNDGFLDCIIFSSKYAYLTNLRLRGFKHPLYSGRDKIHFKAKEIYVEREQYMQVDGDPVLNTEGVRIEILPKQVTFLRNDRDKIDQNALPFLI